MADLAKQFRRLFVICLTRCHVCNSFDDERMEVIRTAAGRNWFTCAQLARMLQVLSFEDERIGAAELMAPKLVDRSNDFTVLSALTFDDEVRGTDRCWVKCTYCM